MINVGLEKITLENALDDYTQPLKGWGESTVGGGTLILVTHDRMLLDRLADRLYVFDGHGNVRHFYGNYSEYLEDLANKEKPGQADTAAGQVLDKTSEKTPGKTDAATTPGTSKPPKSKADKAARASAKPKVSNRYKILSQRKLETQLKETEKRVAEITQLLEEPETYKDRDRVQKLQIEQVSLGADLESLEDEWLRRAE